MARSDSPVRLTTIDLSWIAALSTALGIAILAVLSHGITVGAEATPAKQISAGIVMALAALLGGGLVGFLFGIPRTLQDDGTTANKDDENGKQRYRGNTNLEQISDWLTKILVGVGLTQLHKMPSKLRHIAQVLAPAFGAPSYSEPFVIGLLISFATCGFLLGYLWTRLFLAGALVRADLNTAVRRFEKRLDEQEETIRADAVALALTHSYLQPETNPQSIAVDDMKRAIKRASPGVRVQVFYKAQEVRVRTWREQKPLMERTIPIFEALVEADTKNEFHQNHAQLGFALKDKRQPDWARAEFELTRAIEIRGSDTERWWVLYEFNRAVCRIMLDPDYAKGSASAAATRDAIMKDLSVVHHSGYSRLLNESPVRDWIALNGGEVP